MVLYTRQQLVLLLTLLVAGGAGVAVQRWREAYPELTDRIERFDRAPDAGDVEPVAVPATTPRPGRREPAARPRAKLGAAPGAAVDVNTASPEDLMRLPGVGRALAARIVEARAVTGGFESIDDLRRVRGFGGARLDRLRPFLAVPNAPSPG